MACRICELCRRGCVFISRPKFPAERPGAKECKWLIPSQLSANWNVGQELVDYYERRAPNPTLDFICRAAEASTCQPRDGGTDVKKYVLCRSRHNKGFLTELREIQFFKLVDILRTHFPTDGLHPE